MVFKLELNIWRGSVDCIEYFDGFGDDFGAWVIREHPAVLKCWGRYTNAISRQNDDAEPSGEYKRSTRYNGLKKLTFSEPCFKGCRR